ncbi:MAG TPA: hypothetical protein VHJ69_12685, partial [Gemmatimonadales bacterium]|nr:hypothetical protein [Gemmatimonadales bacterium]
TQSLYENAVEYNLSESGVQPLTVAELLGDELDAAGLGAPALKYPESNGSALLRERIAAFYPGATLDNVLVPSGGSEANYTTLWGSAGRSNPRRRDDSELHAVVGARARLRPSSRSVPAGGATRAGWPPLGLARREPRACSQQPHPGSDRLDRRAGQNRGGTLVVPGLHHAHARTPVR